jgi:hypothetical protein
MTSADKRACCRNGKTAREAAGPPVHIADFRANLGGAPASATGFYVEIDLGNTPKMDDPGDLVSPVSKIGGRQHSRRSRTTALQVEHSRASLEGAPNIRGAAGHSCAAIMCWLALLFSVSQASADDVIQRKFLMDEANLKMSSARTPGDFAVAARTYRKLVDAGVRNGVLFYNLGTALLLGGQYNEAEKNLLRAERYIGSNWEIRRNLLIAVAGRERDKDASLPWYRSLLFWHYGLSGSVRSTIAALAFFVFWLAMALGTLGFRRLARPVAIVSIAVFVVFGSSLATSLHQESLAESGRDYRLASEKPLRP